VKVNRAPTRQRGRRRERRRRLSERHTPPRDTRGPRCRWFGWADLLIGGILIPARARRPVSYRPPRWDERHRAGAIEVPADCPLLIIEGVGAARRESAHLIDVTIWVQADERETERRNLARVGQPGGSPTARHLRDWMAEEIPFLAGQRPWERAGLIACRTPQIPVDAANELVVAPPLGRYRGPDRSTP
jgi:hypothetical protein